MAGFFVILAASLVLAALYITGSIKPPLRAKTAASLAFVVLGLYTLIAPGGRVWAASATGPGIDPFRLLLFCGLCCGALGDVLYVAAFFRVDGHARALIYVHLRLGDTDPPRRRAVPPDRSGRDALPAQRFRPRPADVRQRRPGKTPPPAGDNMSHHLLPGPEPDRGVNGVLRRH